MLERQEMNLALGKLEELYQTWDLRIVILFSLLIQMFLILSAPFRKRTASAFIMIPMWVAYLMADAAATFGIGLISSSTAPEDKRILQAFWAPFLLLHLGGPDTITAFALEDNELWLRHLLQLGFQLGTCAYIFYLNRGVVLGELLFPTLLVFSAGSIKYIERIRCLYLASSNRFQQTSLGSPDPGPNYDKLVGYFFQKKQASIPTVAEIIPPRASRLPFQGKATSLRDLDVLLYARRFFRGSKGLIAELVLDLEERNESRTFFQNRIPRDAFRVVEVELNFFYEILYTKAVVVHSKYGHTLRFSSFTSNIISLVVFHLIDKKPYDIFDVGVTYCLLLGAVFLESIGLIIVLLSDQTAVSLSSSNEPRLFTRIVSKILNVNRKRWPEERVFPCSWLISLPFGWLARVIRRRWSGCISQYNLISYCLNRRSPCWEQFIELFGLKNILDGMKYVKTEKWNDKLRDFIFEELKIKSELADDLESTRDLYMAKGDWVLRFEGYTKLLPWVTEVDFDESLLLWHFATELCFREEGDDPDVSKTPRGPKEKDFCRLAKILSDYMLYLLIIKSPILSSVVGIGQIRFRDTCAEAKIFFDGTKFTSREACKKILKVETAFKSGSIKGYSSKSVLFDGCILAKELQKLDASGKWEIICKVWVEMLCYAACRCRGSTHAAQLGKGGELITVVWLLMSHFGLGNQFQISDFQPRMVLTVAK